MKLRWFLLLMLALLALVVVCKKDDDEESSAAITLTAPNGGESWQQGSLHSITWTSTNVNSVIIRLSVDSGANWTDLATVSANPGNYPWTVSTAPVATCRIMVMDAEHTDIHDVSNADFAIETATQGDQASGSVQTGESGTVTTPDGAQIIVPEGAVPAMADGSPATIVFSIEEDMGFTPTPPNGETVATSVYRFGPEGFVFAQPVEIAVPVPSGTPDNYVMYRVNPTTQQLENMGARYDSTTHTLRAQTVAFSPYFGATRPAVSTAAGCLHVVNLNHDYWVRICVNTFQLTYPDQDLASMPDYGLGGLWAPLGHIGWASEGNFYMPQGSYNLCVQYGEDQNPNHYSHYLTDVTISEAWHYLEHPQCQDFTVGSPVSPDTGMCVCIPTPSVPVGTGAIQVTLTWFNEQSLDLDLWVTEPSGERCYYGNPTTATGGQLDRDNLCGNYINGRPENIFWLTNPPVGEYIVEADWYSDCGNGIASQPIQLRTVVQGNTHTYTPTINNGETLEVVRFNVVGPNQVVFEPSMKSRVVLNKPAK